MSKRLLHMTSCLNCTHREVGKEAAVMYEPMCGAAKRSLPYALHTSRLGRVIAVGTYEIPDWCPLSAAPVTTPQTPQWAW